LNSLVNLSQATALLILYNHEVINAIIPQQKYAKGNLPKKQRWQAYIYIRLLYSLLLLK
jgi:hypothetical protein